MTDYFLDDAANGTNDGLAWATCFNTWAQVNTAAILTATNRLIVGADANITDPGAALTITGPTSGAPAPIISSTVGSGTAVSYSVGTGTQINTTSGAYGITLDGSLALYGIKMSAGARIVLQSDANETFHARNTTFKCAAGSDVYFGSAATFVKVDQCVFDVSADTTNTASAVLIGSGTATVEVIGATFVFGGTQYRTGSVINENSTPFIVSGCDFSGFTHATTCEVSAGNGYLLATNCLTADKPLVVRGGASCHVTMVNCGPAESRTHIFHMTYVGDCVSDTGVYRSGGAAIGATSLSWKVVTTASCSEGSAFSTPWIYGTTTNGTKTFSVAVGHNNAGSGTDGVLMDSEAWLEVQVMGTADSPLYTLTSDRRATITTTAQPQATDASDWTMPGTEVVDKQLLSCADVTVGETGLYRARACFGKAIPTVYVDPKVTVT